MLFPPMFFFFGVACKVSSSWAPSEKELLTLVLRRKAQHSQGFEIGHGTMAPWEATLPSFLGVITTHILGL